jgi:hypothetical protein
MRDIDVVAAQLARSQHGVFNRAQMMLGGGSKRAIDHRVRIRQWERVHPGVYRLPGAPSTWESRVMAACLTMDGSVASHLTAAHLWGLEGYGSLGVVDVTVPRHARPRRRPGVRYHETLAFELRDETRRFGIPVTGPARTVLDVCAAVDDDRTPSPDPFPFRRSLATRDVAAARRNRRHEQAAADVEDEQLHDVDGVHHLRGAEPVLEPVGGENAMRSNKGRSARVSGSTAGRSPVVKPIVVWSPGTNSEGQVRPVDTMCRLVP